MAITLLSGGAAHGLVEALSAQFEAETGEKINGTFGAVGWLKDELMGGAAADLVILTRQMIGELEGQGLVVAGSSADIGTVHACIAIRAGDPVPDIGDAAALKAALEAADAIYFPDPVKATAGIHFASVLRRLGVADHLRGKIRTFPNGAQAMAALAAHAGGRPIGSTQSTEIIGKPGVMLAGRLPHELELATTYTVAITTGATSAATAARLAALLTGEAAAQQRADAGFAMLG